MTFAWLAAGALPLAWGLDACFGEPTVGTLSPGSAWRWRRSGAGCAPCGQRSRSALARWLVFALALGGVACGVEIALVSLPAWIAVPLLAVVLKPTFAWRMLHTEVAAVERAAAGGVARSEEHTSELQSL